MNHQQRKEYMIKWRLNHPAQVKEYESRYKEMRHQYRLNHREKYKNYNKEYRKKNAEKLRQYNKIHSEDSRNNTLKRKYGITTKEYDTMLLYQNGQCASCKASQKDFKRRFHVDHNHFTGDIRGLLCVNCNHLVGLFEKNPDYFENVKKYLT